MNNIQEELVVLDHGTGGLLSNKLISDVIVSTLQETYTGLMEDSFVARQEDQSGILAMTTDSFVITPQIFGNGDIGKVAICGTVNDLAVSGATPRYLTLALVLEEGLPIRILRQILTSAREAAREAGIKIVAGDTKVVKRGEVDKIFINTAGVGFVAEDRVHLKPSSIQNGDHIIISSYLGDHSIHILSMREGLGFENQVLSDCAPLNNMIESVLVKYGKYTRCMRDVTRGGLGTVLNEFANEKHMHITIHEKKLPIRLETQMASEMLGINPIYLANEGCLCMFVDPNVSSNVVEELRKHKYGCHATIIGEIQSSPQPTVSIVAKDGDVRTVEHLEGMELPRLC